jgi:hypothetical protein
MRFIWSGRLGVNEVKVLLLDEEDGGFKLLVFVHVLQLRLESLHRNLCFLLLIIVLRFIVVDTFLTAVVHQRVLSLRFLGLELLLLPQ